MSNVEKKRKHPWLRAATTTITRVSPLTQQPQPLDRGSNFFVLALEALGANTRFCCEGHPTGFYVAFDAPYELVTRIKSAGFFRVEVEAPNYWTIRLHEVTAGTGELYAEKDRKRVLKWATEAWLKKFPEQLMHLA